MIAIILKIFLAIAAAIFSGFFIQDLKQNGIKKDDGNFAIAGGVGFIVNFLDTLGIGSFAITTVLLRALKQIQDRLLPGTLNVMCTIPTIMEAFIFLQIIQVDGITLSTMVVAAAIGGWIGANYVIRLPEQKIRLAMAIALTVTASFMLLNQVHLLPIAHTDAIGLSGIKLVIAIIASGIIGVLGSVGIGFYAPCLATVYLLGMSAKAAFPIMMSGCSIVSAVASLKFIKSGTYNRKVAAAMALFAIPAVLIAAYIIKTIPLHLLTWLVVIIIYYTALSLFLAYRNREKLTIKAAQK